MTFNKILMEAEGAGGGTPGATGTPAAVVTPPPAAAVEAGKAGDAPFYSGWKDDAVKGWVQTKGFKDPESIANSALNLERLHGVPRERLVKLPEKADDAEGWNNVYNQMGRPKDPKEYKLPVPKEGAPDPAFMETAAGMFHKAGLSQSQAETVTGEWNNYVANIQKAQAEARELQNTQDHAQLKKEWGKAFDDNIEVAKKGARTFGLDGPTIDKLETALGFSGLMKFMQSIGSKLGEGDFVAGAGHDTFKSLTPANAKSQIEYLKTDPAFMEKYLKGDKASVEKMTRLFSNVNG